MRIRRRSPKEGAAEQSQSQPATAADESVDDVLNSAAREPLKMQEITHRPLGVKRTRAYGGANLNEVGSKAAEHEATKRQLENSLVRLPAAKFRRISELDATTKASGSAAEAASLTEKNGALKAEVKETIGKTRKLEAAKRYWGRKFNMEVDNRRESVRQYEAELKQAQEMVASLEKQLGNAKLNANSVEMEQEKRQVAEAHVAKLQSERDSLVYSHSAESEALQTQVAQLESSLATTDANWKESEEKLRAEIEARFSEKKTMETQLADATTKASSSAAEAASLTVKNGVLEAEVKEAKGKTRKFKAAKSNYWETQYSVMASLMGMQREQWDFVLGYSTVMVSPLLCAITM